MQRRQGNTDASSAPVIDIVLDIDDTLVSMLERQVNGQTLPFNNFTDVLKCYPHFAQLENEHFIKARDHYLIAPGALELITWLLQNPVVKLSFFSAGEESRNQYLITQLFNRQFGRDGDHAKQAITIYSKQHLEKFSINFLGKTTYIKRKNLACVNSTTLDNVILVDNDPSFFHPNQTRNLLRAPGFNYIMFDEIARSDPRTISDTYLLGVNHIFYTAGLLCRALKSENGTCLADKLYALQYSNANNRDVFNFGLFRDYELYKEGLQLLQTVNPDLNFYLPGLLEDKLVNRDATPLLSPPTHTPILPMTR